MKIGRIKLGSEFIEADCYHPKCVHRDSMPKLVFHFFKGYGTKRYPSHEHLQEAKRAVREHGHHWNIRFWIGKG